MSSNIVLYKNFSDLDIDFPEANEALAKNTVTRINNAIEEGAIIDKNGVLWIRTDKLDDVWRTDKPTARQMVLQIPEGKFRRTFGGKEYVRSAEVTKWIFYRLESATGTKEKYLKHTKNILQSVIEEPALRVFKLEAALAWQSQKKLLKGERIRRYAINIDELTGTVLKRGLGSDFSHIISAASDPELADQIWNGLVVNTETHKLITAKEITNHEDLLCFCEEEKWSTSWYDDFHNSLNKFYEQCA
jgi:hypothetical protein